MSTATQTLNLSKDQKVDLTKTNPGLKKVGIGLGWDFAPGKSFDLDSFLFLCKDGKTIDPDPMKSVIYFGNKQMPGCLHHGDNLTGAGDGDDEVIDVEFDKLPAECNEVIVGINIFNAGTNNFGMVRNAFARIYDAADSSKTSIIKYDLSEDYGTSNAVIFGKLYKHNGEWKFQALGTGATGDINALLTPYKP